MCGIAGIAGLDRQPVQPAELAVLSRLLGHRGPDGEGTHRADGVALAHRRLAIIDPRAGHQPLTSEDGRIAITYNGEVYNYRELRRELEGEFAFATQSDTEVVLKAYQKWGIDCVQRFRGMFAFALHDAASGLLYLVRDRVGIKPLYYCLLKDRVAFASELGALLSLPWVPRDIDPEALAEYFRFSYVPTPKTIYRTVRKLEPGHWMAIDTRSGRVAKHRYWKLAVRIEERPESELLERLNALLDDIIRIYVRSDVPFGCFLSGGVDSSLVAALMARQLEAPLRTFSIGFDESAHSELPYAREASRILRSAHHEKVVTPQLAADTLLDLARQFGEPFADSSAIPTYYVSREAAAHVKMVLSGDGGDELFAGYDSYPATWRDAQAARAPARTLFYRMLAHAAPSARIRRAARHRSRSLREKHDAQRHIYDDRALRALLPGIQPNGPHEAVTSQLADPVTHFQAEDFNTYLPDDVLTKVDRMSMAHSLEVRVPLLDHLLVEFAFSLPLSAKIRARPDTEHPHTKYLLKKSAARFFSAQFLDRRKRGFGIPIVEWCQRDLLPVIEQRLGDPRNSIYEWVSREAAAGIVSAFRAGAVGEVAKLWALMMFDAWMTRVHRA
jgi:asparagine synthase (glutamine-hydrolysing)